MFTSALIQRALDEDIGAGDITTLSIVPPNLKAKGIVLTKEELGVAGMGVTGGVSSTIDPTVQIEQHVTEGEFVEKGRKLMTVHGLAHTLLRGGRGALNFLQRLCGIATLTRKFVKETEGTKTKIFNT